MKKIRVLFLYFYIVPNNSLGLRGYVHDRCFDRCQFDISVQLQKLLMQKCFLVFFIYYNIYFVVSSYS
jgi:hypothetical protein